jgi:hypothetical protein
MGFWDAVDKALAVVADGADRVVTTAAEDVDKYQSSLWNTKSDDGGTSVWGMKGKDAAQGEVFSWGGGGKVDKKDGGGVSFW